MFAGLYGQSPQNKDLTRSNNFCESSGSPATDKVLSAIKTRPRVVEPRRKRSWGNLLRLHGLQQIEQPESKRVVLQDARTTAEPIRCVGFQVLGVQLHGQFGLVDVPNEGWLGLPE